MNEPLISTATVLVIISIITPMKQQIFSIVVIALFSDGYTNRAHLAFRVCLIESVEGLSGCLVRVVAGSRVNKMDALGGTLGLDGHSVSRYYYSLLTSFKGLWHLLNLVKYRYKKEGEPQNSPKSRNSQRNYLENSP